MAKGVIRGLVSRSLIILAVAILAGVMLSSELLRHTEQRYLQRLSALGDERLKLYASTIEAIILRFDYLPFIIAEDRQMASLLSAAQESEAISRRLQQWQQESGVAELYLMDRQGVVLAASNWQHEESFVGRDYHFRPYFKDAMAGREGLFFAIGVTTGQPGLFLSRAVRVEGKIAGVAVAKVNLQQLEANWALGGETLWVTDQDGVIFLASKPTLKYRSLQPLNQLTLQRLERERRYGPHPLTPLGIADQGSSDGGKRLIEFTSTALQLSLDSSKRGFMLHSQAINELGWRLYYLSSLSELADAKRDVAIMTLLATLLVALLGTIVVSRIRNRQMLERRVEMRTRELNESNTRLTAEVAERIHAESELQKTHEGLLHAERLAAVGQLSAGLVHEISQPLSAMQTFTASARLLIRQQQTEDALQSIDEIDSMARRVSAIIANLKSYARKSTVRSSPVDLIKVIDNTLLLLSSRLSQEGLTLHWQPPQYAIRVLGSEVKLEQIVVNLISNALDAMEQQRHPHTLSIGVEAAAEGIAVRIRDSGAGIASEALEDLFVPFYTTKESGQGLGLGLSVSEGLAHEFGGRIVAANHPDGGAEFTLWLHQAKEIGGMHGES